MYTFVFITNRHEALSHDHLRHYAKIVKNWMPALGIELAEKVTLLPEGRSGWFCLAPACETSFSLVSEWIDERYAVLVFGHIDDGGSNSAAQTVFDAWMDGGPTVVRKLEGCFSSVILDRTDGAVMLIGDMMGRRALNYFADSQGLVVSPHDVALMGTGRIPVEFDEVSICSVAAVEWSLQNKSLLKHVHTCHPAEYIRWADGHIQHVADPILRSDQRIHAKDTKAVSGQLDQMIALAQANTRIFAGDRQEVHCDLSAGLDSRVILSLLLSVIKEPSRILAISTGEENNLDVRIARRLAKLYGTRFLSYVPTPPSPDGFMARCDMLAFAMNGGTPGKRAIKYPTEFVPNPQANACGNGGEIFRGYYYLHNPLGPRLSLSPGDALAIMKKRTRLRKLPWANPELADAVVARLDCVIQEYAAISANGYDILDLCYLYERMGVWGASTARQTWKNPRWSPFMSPQVIRMAFMMPSPIAKFATIHHETLRRFTPRAYWVRVNGKLLVLEGEGTIKQALKTIDRICQGGLSRVQKMLQPAKFSIGRKDTDQIAEDELAGTLMDTVREVLMSGGSFPLLIFGRKGLELLLKEHESRTHNHLEVLGLLVSMERWRAMVQGVAREAATG